MKANQPAVQLQFRIGRIRVPSSFTTTALALALLFGAGLGCKSLSSSTHSGPPNPALDLILDARNKHDASEALLNHGSLRAEEVQYVYEATSDSGETRRHNAAHLLITTIKGNAVELQHKALLETKDVVVWAVLVDDLLDKEHDLAGKRPAMIKAALAEKDPEVLAVGLRTGALSNYPGIRALARQYLDHPDGKVRAAAVSGLLPDDIRELLPRLTEMISKEKDEDTFISLAKSLIRVDDANATAVVIKGIEHLKETGDTLWLHFFNDLALFTVSDPMIDKFLFALAQSNSPVREEGFSVLSRQVWANHREPSSALVKMCSAVIEKGTLSTDPRRKPEASEEQNDCEELLSFMNNGKNPIGDFAGRVRGANAVAFAKKWLQEHGG
jgi:hypothetical protein